MTVVVREDEWASRLAGKLAGTYKGGPVPVVWFDELRGLTESVAWLTYRWFLKHHRTSTLMPPVFADKYRELHPQPAPELDALDEQCSECPGDGWVKVTVTNWITDVATGRRIPDAVIPTTEAVRPCRCQKRTRTDVR